MRIDHPRLRAKRMSADDAAEMVSAGDHVGMSGFTGSGYPKALPAALARRAAASDGRFSIGVWTGASTAASVDGVLAASGGLDFRMPYQSDPIARAKINAGTMDYVDVHLSHVAQMVWEGFFGPLDVAVVEGVGITAAGELIPSTSVGNNKTWLDRAELIIVEINERQPPGLDGFHDIYYGTALPPHRRPILIERTSDRIGQNRLRLPLDKVCAVVTTDEPDVAVSFRPPDDTSRAIAEHLIDFYSHEVARGRLPRSLLPIQSGVGNVANAVLDALADGDFEPMTAYTEVIQDSMLTHLRSGIISHASATAVSLSEAGRAEFESNLDHYRSRIVLRPQEISNHPEVIRRLGCLAMNGMIEADIYGNVNSTHVMGSAIQNGIGGSGDFARNAYISAFMTPSTAKGDSISCIVPMVSHVDHTEHDVSVVVTEQGLADLRGLPPRSRAHRIIDRCAHPDYRDMLRDYFDRALATSVGKHTPHLLDEALSWHRRYLQTGSMK